MIDDREGDVRVPSPIEAGSFNPSARLPYGLTADSIGRAMGEFHDFLSFVNTQLGQRGLARLETILMPANFSSLVGEFVANVIPRHCSGLVRNRYHNGYPDLIPARRFPEDAAQHGDAGIEVKASHYPSGWQGHNAEVGWLMVFVFDSNRPRDLDQGMTLRPFRFVKVVAAQLDREHWSYSGRSGASRRTITASVIKAGCQLMDENWIYLASERKGE